MVAAVMLSSLAALLIVYLFMPALWFSFLNDDPFAVHEARRALVASKNPFRESGPPANMAKLILLRHKIQTSNRKRRNSSQARASQRPSYHVAPLPRPKNTWMRFGKPFGGRQHH
ncbi:hypothetical protein BD626DRAFT_565303 [Schizophyllum amplum]|uniref:Uncharacterized protein n=1 Tax=Schizophyllum amplum TaxID=97359 RepID=A0A550CUJ9_9AGAR|nr:hypothetical protein BD626DRAFT_565303 [Auriculariopsis ampla]